jgi:hypothetical protein
MKPFAIRGTARRSTPPLPHGSGGGFSSADHHFGGSTFLA